jgi:two-component system sensor histidine kinase GlrK
MAAMLAAGLGIWLARPFQRMERAIVGLGQNRLEEPIDIGGPADVRRVSVQLEWLRLRLTELDADKARFLRHVSHELKTPLAALREGVSLLEEGVAGEINSRQREVTRILQHNATVLQERIEALLRFNAAAFDARQLRREKTDLLALLQDHAEAQRLQWQARGVRVEVTGDPLLLPVDPDKLGTAVANLLSNAIRFCPPGGTIRVALQDLPGRASIEVSDDGPGVAPADRERIFEPFYRGERQPEDAPPGTGIGLSIVNEYIAAHGGRIELLAQDHKPGARFRIELPYAT